MSIRGYERFVNPALSEFLRASGRAVHFTAGDGHQLRTADGDVYHDWIAGFGSLNFGHDAPKIREALRVFLDGRTPNLYPEGLNAVAGALAERLIALLGSAYDHVFFSNSGSEAVEAALKLARAATGREAVVYCRGGYHGTTFGALSMMHEGDYRDPFGALLPAFDPVGFLDLNALEAALAPGQVAAFVVEPIQVESGVRALSPAQAAAARALCDRFGTLLVFDEAQTGMGRTGTALFAEQLGVAPDVVVLAKALGGGLAPLGATVSGRGNWRRAFGTYATAEAHHSTFGGNALACTAGLAAVETLASPDFLPQVRRTAAALAEAAQTLARHPAVRGVRLHGMLGGVELEAFDHPLFDWTAWGVPEFAGRPVAGAAMVHRLFRRRHLVQVCGHAWSTLRVQPPLTVPAEACAAFVTALAEELDWLLEAR